VRSTTSAAAADLSVGDSGIEAAEAEEAGSCLGTAAAAEAGEAVLCLETAAAAGQGEVRAIDPGAAEIVAAAAAAAEDGYVLSDVAIRSSSPYHTDGALAVCGDVGSGGVGGGGDTAGCAAGGVASSGGCGDDADELFGGVYVGDVDDHAGGDEGGNSDGDGVGEDDGGYVPSEDFMELPAGATPPPAAAAVAAAGQQPSEAAGSEEGMPEGLVDAAGADGCDGVGHSACDSDKQQQEQERQQERQQGQERQRPRQRRQQQQRQVHTVEAGEGGEAAGRGGIGVACRCPVEAQVSAFVASVLEPLLRAGVVSERLAEVVVVKAVEKIMLRHQGSSDGGFLVREYTSITKLVTALVDHYQKKGVV
jgi:septum formation inhibitor MinC